MHDVSTSRLYVLRATYLVIAVGVGLMIWPLLLDAPQTVEHFRGVTWCLLGAVAVLAVVGIRYPLGMLPLLLFELLWKATWLVAIGLPLRRTGALAGDFAETWFANVLGVVVVSLAIPWGYVARTYLRAPGDRWRPSAAAVSAVRADVRKA
jgi:hypothetical protein